MFIIFTFFSCASPNYAEKLGGAKPSMKAFYSPILLAFFILLVVLSCCVIIQNICILFSTHIPNIVLILELLLNVFSSLGPVSPVILGTNEVCPLVDLS